MWPSSTAAAPSSPAAASSAAYRAARAAASGPAVAPDLDAHDAHRVEPEGARLLGRAFRRRCRAILQPVVDDDGARPHPGARRLERGRRGERERVGPAAERDEHEARRRGSASRTARRTSATAGVSRGREGIH